MNFAVHINIMPLKELLDPQGKAILGSLQNLNLASVSDVRVGKRIDLTLIANDEAGAKAIAEEACKKLLANPVMEQYEYTVVAL